MLLATAAAAFFAGLAVLFTGSTFGLYSASTPRSAKTFTAGTVTQSNYVSSSCSVTNLLPDGTQHACGTLQTTYSGNEPAYLGLDVLIETQHAVGGTNLFNPAAATHLSVSISSSSPSVASYQVPVVANLTTCPSGAAPGSTCYEVDDDLVSKTPFSNSSGAVTFSTAVTLPTSSPSSDQGGSAQIVLTVHATQSENNGSVTGCSAGQSCTAVGWN